MTILNRNFWRQNLKFGPTGQPGLRIFRFGTRESKDIFILEIILILHTNIIGTLIHILRYPIILMGSILVERFYCIYIHPEYVPLLYFPLSSLVSFHLFARAFLHYGAFIYICASLHLRATRIPAFYSYTSSLSCIFSLSCVSGLSVLYLSSLRFSISHKCVLFFVRVIASG